MIEIESHNVVLNIFLILFLLICLPIFHWLLCMSQFLSKFANAIFMVMTTMDNLVAHLFFLIFFSALAFIHTLLYNAAFRKKISPEWGLFAVHNGIGAVLYIIDPQYIIYWVYFLVGIIILVFILVLILGIGMKIHSNIKDIISDKVTGPFYRNIFNLLLGALFISLFLSYGSSILPLFFIAVFIFIISTNLSKYKNGFFKFQSILPTSKIHSMSMGLVELEGQVKGIELLRSPIDSKECIAYIYEIDKISLDEDGRETLFNVHSEKKCNRFIITDDTGSVEVDPDKLRLEMLPIDEQYRSGKKRYTQRLLKNEDLVLLIGKASVENNNPLIVYEESQRIFGIAPVDAVTLWNRYKPLYKKMLLYITIFAFFVALILTISIQEVDGYIVVSLTNNLFSEFNTTKLWKGFLH